MVRRVVDTGRTATRICTFAEGFVPLHRTFRRTGDRLSTGDTPFCSLTREELFEDHTVTVPFLCCGGVVWETVLRGGKHLVGNLLLSNVLQVVYPSIANTVTELFLLPPQDIIGQVRVIGRVEGLTDRPLLNLRIFLRYAWALTDHLLFRVQIHRHLQKVSIQERDTRLDAPGTHGLVATQAIVHVKTAELVDSFVEKFLRVGRLVEVQVPTEDLIGTLTTDNHFDTHSLDLTCHEVHRSRRPDRCNVVRFQTLYDITDSIGTLLERVRVRVMDRT
mmetsp:Transcript_14426/g.34920  ORF Transcript_14426/g.34920 Transcript_14426/m.34920 type:complete len:276 (+) Transcript_14426:220-1047(+)